MTTASTNFDPKVHGFRFVNNFDFPNLFNMGLAFPGFRAIGEIVYGLCGGMCCAALDYYLDGKPVPVESNVDSISLKLFRYLWMRQLNTLTTSVLEKLLAWSFQDTRALHKKTAQDEVPAIMQSINSGAPCVLVLVRSKGPLKMTENHQVLAIGYKLDPDTKDLSIQLYDPNYPGTNPELTMNLTRPSSGIKLAETTGDSLRGFFKIEYSQITPP
jgi:hypothetical protein